MKKNYIPFLFIPFIIACNSEGNSDDTPPIGNEPTYDYDIECKGSPDGERVIEEVIINPDPNTTITINGYWNCSDEKIVAILDVMGNFTAQELRTDTYSESHTYTLLSGDNNSQNFIIHELDSNNIQIGDLSVIELNLTFGSNESLFDQIIPENINSLGSYSTSFDYDPNTGNPNSVEVYEKSRINDGTNHYFITENQCDFTNVIEWTCQSTDYVVDENGFEISNQVLPMQKGVVTTTLDPLLLAIPTSSKSELDKLLFEMNLIKL